MFQQLIFFCLKSFVTISNLEKPVLYFIGR